VTCQPLHHSEIRPGIEQVADKDSSEVMGRKGSKTRGKTAAVPRYKGLLAEGCPKFRFQKTLTNSMNTNTDAKSINQSRTECVSRKS